MRFIILLTLMLFSTLSFANGLQQSAFMRAFHDCVSQYSGEEQNYETTAVSESALMNGEFLAGNIDAGFFNYMNCITQTSVSQGPSNLTTDLWCPHTEYTVNSLGLGLQVQLPYKRSGESVRIKGLDFTCVNGGWDFISALDNEGSVSGCASQRKESGSCRFDLPNSEHANVSRVFNFTRGFDGQAAFVCDNGNWLEINTQCQPATCEVGQRVSWFDVQGGEAKVCQGEVSGAGLANATLGNDIQYFPNTVQARAQSSVLFGTANFSCKNGQWQRESGSGFCREKTPAEKGCVQVNNNNAFCQ